MTRVLVLYYSSYGHVRALAQAEAEGARSVPGTHVDLRRVPETVPEKIRQKAGFAEDDTPLDEASTCPASRDYSKAYLHHLVKAEEILGQVLLSWHNIAHFQALTAAMRAAIAEGRFEAFRRDFRSAQRTG